MSHLKSATPKAPRPPSRRKLLQRNGVDPAAVGGRVAESAERRTVRVGIVGVTFVCVVLLLTQGEPAIDIKAGQRARCDYVSRLAFECEDLEAALYQRNIASRQQPSYYVLESQAAERQQADVLSILQRIQWDSDLESVVRSLGKRRINVLEPKQFRQEVLALGEELKPLVARVFERLAKWGILSIKQYRDELVGGHEEIVIIHRDGAATQKVKLTELVSVGDAGRELSEKRIAEALAGQSDIFRSNFRNIIERCLLPTLKFDPDATERARDEAVAKVEPPVKQVLPWSILLRRGVVARQHHIHEIQAERGAYAANVRWSWAQVQVMAGMALPLIIVFWCLGVYIRRYRPELVEANARLFMLCALCLFVLAAAHVLIRAGLPAVLTPLALASIIVSICHGERFGLLISTALALGIGAMQDGGMAAALVLGLGGAAAAVNCRKIDRRTTLIRIGLLTGVVQFCALWAAELLRFESPMVVTFEWAESALMHSLWALGNGVAVGLLVSSTLPVIEYLFDTTTDITLLELSDLNQPALQELMLNAPGTYHHSLMVGVLSEEAAKAVNANPLLTRVGAYYHDLGKMLKPEYFVENVATGVSQHTDLAPQMSALVITAHTKDGMRLAEEYALPNRLKQIVEQHHGTTRVEYFYREALKENGAENVEEDSFRYRGPKAQSTEAAIVMLADSVESASRVLSEPNPSRIEGLVDEIVDRKMRDGQLDECSLTFRELTQIRRSLARCLTATFHSRIKYPKPIGDT